MRFTKWHGIGNDFLIVMEEELRAAGIELDPATVIAICDRHFGVGGDGILVLGPSETADAKMVIHNADGSTAMMCGNGIRVAARQLVEDGIVTPGSDGSFAIETEGGIMRPTVLDDGRVQVDMGVLVSEGATSIDLGTCDAELAGKQLDGHVVSVGNPHFAVRRAPEGHDMHRLGRAAEVHPRFPHRSNIEFWELEADRPNHVRMRVWERGVGETLACGTGACAVAYAARAAGVVGDTVTVTLPGGDLDVSFDGDRAVMTGAAHRAWSGELDPATIRAGMPPAPSTHA